jgi:hypothetical protein
MNDRIKELLNHAVIAVDNPFPGNPLNDELEKMYIPDCFAEKFAELIVRECIDKIETYRIPVGNSPAGELACEWTYDALKDIRDDIEEHFGVAK